MVVVVVAVVVIVYGIYEKLPSTCMGGSYPNNSRNSFKKPPHSTIWVVVKIRVRFWVPEIIGAVL